jgi:PIN domain nuclease of toxin-antitoxin system
VKYLFDTSVWLWSLSAPERIGREGLSVLGRAGQEFYFSAVTSWEIAIKWSLGKLLLPEPPESYVPKRMADQRILPLPITHRHTLAVSKLPAKHGDPFDRLLIAQARAEEMAILTADRVFRLYDVETVWCGS